MTMQTTPENVLRKACIALAKKECANMDDRGCCLLTDTPCEKNMMTDKYTIADGAILCDYFLKCVLPLKQDLNDTIVHLIWAERDLWSDDEDSASSAASSLKLCPDCGIWFVPGSNAQKRCRNCSAKARKRENAQSHKLRFWRAK